MFGGGPTVKAPGPPPPAPTPSDDAAKRALADERMARSRARGLLSTIATSPGGVMGASSSALGGNKLLGGA